MDCDAVCQDESEDPMSLTLESQSGHQLPPSEASSAAADATVEPLPAPAAHSAARTAATTAADTFTVAEPGTVGAATVKPTSASAATQSKRAKDTNPDGSPSCCGCITGCKNRHCSCVRDNIFCLHKRACSNKRALFLPQHLPRYTPKDSFPQLPPTPPIAVPPPSPHITADADTDSTPVQTPRQPTPTTPLPPPTPNTPPLPPTIPDIAPATDPHDPARDASPHDSLDDVPPEIQHPLFKKMFGEDFDKCNTDYTTRTSSSPRWSARWEFIAPIKCSIYGAHFLSSATTKRIIDLVTKEFRLLADKKGTSHRVACLTKLVLIQDPNVKNGTSHKRAIHDLIHRRLSDWKAERYEKLYEEGASIARTYALPYLDHAPNTNPAVIESLTTQARLSAACSLATNYSPGGLLKPDDFVTSKDGTKRNVREVLHSKLPACVDQPHDSLDDPDELPPLLHLTVTEDTVKQAAKNLQGAAGPDGLPGDLVKQWLTKFGATSRKLRKVIADLTNLCANTTLSDSEAPLISALLDSSLIASTSSPGSALSAWAPSGDASWPRQYSLPLTHLSDRP